MTEDPYECNYRDDLPELNRKLTEIERSVVEEPDMWCYGEKTIVYWSGERTMEIQYIWKKGQERRIYWYEGMICSLPVDNRLLTFFTFAPSQKERVQSAFAVVKARYPK